ncbi:FAD/NAD(P)-binding protein [Terrihabitans sp. B22-R8]|uniref:FAD/NAD(P)-binding protein n=1 Tax=Terrihabitans sp. B22-R8 TaxID=3425128 RepID=UPI00403C4A20
MNEWSGRGGRPHIVIIGGGLTGAVLTMNLAYGSPRPLDVTVIEPRGWVGGGLAYSTSDPAHRVNVPTTKMSVFSQDPAHFDRWVRDNHAVDGDRDAELPDGRIFPRRLVFGTYARSELMRSLVGTKINFSHVQDRAVSAQRTGEGWSVEVAQGDVLAADLLVIATSHPPPAPPAIFSRIVPHPRIVADPWASDALGAVQTGNDVLIVGTGLTMADVVASLERRGHEGRIIAVSRRGLTSRGHSAATIGPYGDFTNPPPATALELLLRIRTAVAQAADLTLPWHSVLDAVRRDASAIWSSLPSGEKRRLVRHLRPFWDVHRYRVAPQIEAALQRRRDVGGLEIISASLREVRDAGSRIEVDLSLRGRKGGTKRTISVDHVVLTNGPGHESILKTNGALSALADQGFVQPDGLGLGLLVDDENVAIGVDGHPVGNLLVAGPLARGKVGELMGLPQITLHAEMVAKHALLWADDWWHRNGLPLEKTA